MGRRSTPRPSPASDRVARRSGPSRASRLRGSGAPAPPRGGAQPPGRTSPRKRRIPPRPGIGGVGARPPTSRLLPVERAVKPRCFQSAPGARRRPRPNLCGPVAERADHALPAGDCQVCGGVKRSALALQRDRRPAGTGHGSARRGRYRRGGERHIERLTVAPGMWKSSLSPLGCDAPVSAANWGPAGPSAQAQRPRLDLPGLLLGLVGLFALVYGFSTAETHSSGSTARFVARSQSRRRAPSPVSADDPHGTSVHEPANLRPGFWPHPWIQGCRTLSEPSWAACPPTRRRSR
jgi:hypothetical protein